MAFRYQTETATRAALADRYEGVAYAHMKLAELHEENSRQGEADRHIRVAEEAMLKIESEVVRNLMEIDLRLAKVRILAHREDPSILVAVLSDGLDLLAQEEVNVFYEQQYRMELANAYRSMGETDRADAEFALAVQAVEREDNALDSRARLAFDDQRREIYEAAIAFEWDRKHMEAARAYALRYHAKLLMEAAAPYATEEQTFAERVLVVREEWNALGDGRLLEYTLLKDRILMWVISRDFVEGRSYQIDRDDLQEKVERFMQLITDLDRGDELGALAKDLHGILIAPVVDLLEEADSVAIVRTVYSIDYPSRRSAPKTSGI